MSPLSPDTLRERVEALTVWKRGDQRAPHKPLLLLYALARFADGHERMPYSEIEPHLRRLLDDFGPARKTHHPNYPFWRLQHDGLWTLDGAEGLPSRKSNTDPPVTALRKHNPVGQFPREVAATLRAHPALIAHLASDLLEAHFPDSLHDDLLGAIGLDLDALDERGRTDGAFRRRRRRRDPTFREAVLRAYSYRCAVCGFDARVGHTLIGLDAAHVKWRQAGGPDAVENGLALCAVHHRLLDRGAWTLTPEGRMQVAEEAHGGETFERWVLAYHGRPVAAPVAAHQRVAEPHLTWHYAEVFRRPARP